MKIGYARKSTDDQNIDLQVAALESAQCEAVFVDEGVSGGTDPMRRDGFAKAIEALPPGGTLMVWKLDRLGRSLSSIIATIDDLAERDIQFVSLTENIDTTSIHGRALWQMIGVFAELERSIIRERTRAGLEAARRRGSRIGRPPVLDADRLKEARSMIAGGMTVIDAAERLAVSKSTLYQRLALAS